MKYMVMGTDYFAKALAYVGEATGVFSLCSAKSADLAIACGTPQEVEAQALQALEMGIETAVPGWIAGDFELLARLHLRFTQREKKLILLFPDRYAPNVRDVQRVQQTGCLGRVGIVDYRNQWPQKCSALLPLAEALDTAFLWLGEPEKARGFRVAAEDVECATLSVQFESGALLNLAAVTSLYEKRQTTYEWSGSNGNLAYDSCEAKSVILPQEEEVRLRFPTFGTRVCPVRAMLEDLPRIIQEHGAGVCEQDWKLACLIRKAFEKEGEKDA